MAVLFDTSVLIGAAEDPEMDGAISVVSLTELHFGVLVAPDDDTRSRRIQRLGAIEDHFNALSFDAAVARECGRLHAAVAQRGGNPRRRALDLAIAATANVHEVTLLTYNIKDFQIIDDLVDVCHP
ncbi:MAG TPA: PIN domain-containing protein [Solirubrobacterales bacterium]|nr:PIN domain-containing protein [Solirubrobacterales bacterium]